MKRTPHPRRRRRNAGFSLIELLVVLGILALLASYVGPKVVGYFDRAKSQTAVTQVESLRAALDLFLLDAGRYPLPEEGLAALAAAPPGATGWRGPYLAQGLPADPWGRAYGYAVAEGGTPVVFTLGSDGKEGGTGEAADYRR